MPRIRATSIDEHKALTRASLLASAKSLIADAGTAEIPLGEIALASGVGRTTLYDYFVDRDDLIATMVEAIGRPRSSNGRVRCRRPGIRLDPAP